MKKLDVKERVNILELLNKQSKFSGAKQGFGPGTVKASGTKFVAPPTRVTQHKGGGGK